MQKCDFSKMKKIRLHSVSLFCVQIFKERHRVKHQKVVVTFLPLDCCWILGAGPLNLMVEDKRATAVFLRQNQHQLIHRSHRKRDETQLPVCHCISVHLCMICVWTILIEGVSLELLFLFFYTLYLLTASLMHQADTMQSSRMKSSRLCF